MSACGMGGMGFKSQFDQVTHIIPMIHYRCILDVWPWRKVAEIAMDT